MKGHIRNWFVVDVAVGGFLLGDKEGKRGTVKENKPGGDRYNFCFLENSFSKLD